MDKWQRERCDFHEVSQFVEYEIKIKIVIFELMFW